MSAVDVQPSAAPPEQGPPATIRFRADLEGLRAIAVLLVLLDHIVGWPKGGFVGVDVFFVLSGFLITGLLLKEIERTGRISFKQFYARRIKRILPAATLVIVVTAISAYVIFIGARVNQVLLDGLWAVLFAANWRFILVGQDYFAADRAVSPYQHYWSLAVEEQFYVVWPLLILLIVLLSRSRDRAYRRRMLIVALSAVIVVSFAWAMLETASDPTSAYFSTLSRAWELGVGGLLAVLAGKVTAQHHRIIRLLIGTGGLAIIVLSGWLLSPDWAFPGPWAVLPVTGTLLVILSAVNAPADTQSPLLTHPLTRYVGQISFSLYLWHWPVVVFLQVFTPPDATIFYLGAFGISLALSMASYHFVENPIRHSSWLTGPSPHQRLLVIPEVMRQRRRLLAQVSAFALVMPAAIALGYAAIKYTAVPPSATALPQPFDQAPSTEANQSAEPELSREIRIALEARSWPAFVVPLEDLEETKAPEWSVDGCIDVTSADLERCTYEGPSNKTVVVVGDSVAVSWLPGIRAAAAQEGFEVVSLTMGQCPAAMVQVTNNTRQDGFADRCSQFQEWAADTIDELKPELVVLSSAENSLERLVPQAAADATQLAWQQGTRAMLERLSAPNRRLAVLAPPPARVSTCNHA